MSEIEVKILDTESIRKLRHKVLWPHLESYQDCVIDPDFDERTFHMGAVKDGKVVGTSTFIVDINDKFEEKNQYRLRAMATDPEIRGTGTGAKILEKGIEELRKREIKLLWCDARLNATGFYEKMNFSVIGGIYDVPKIGPHKTMYIDL